MPSGPVNVLLHLLFFLMGQAEWHLAVYNSLILCSLRHRVSYTPCDAQNDLELLILILLNVLPCQVYVALEFEPKCFMPAC